jgi:hypothetical protein
MLERCLREGVCDDEENTDREQSFLFKNESPWSRRVDPVHYLTARASGQGVVPPRGTAGAAQGARGVGKGACVALGAHGLPHQRVVLAVGAQRANRGTGPAEPDQVRRVQAKGKAHGERATSARAPMVREMPVCGSNATTGLAQGALRRDARVAVSLVPALGAHGANDTVAAGVGPWPAAGALGGPRRVVRVVPRAAATKT